MGDASQRLLNGSLLEVWQNRSGLNFFFCLNLYTNKLMESLMQHKKGLPTGRLAIRAARGLLNHLVHSQTCRLFPIAKPPSRLNYLRDWDSVTALGKQLIAQSISLFQFFWLNGKRLEKEQKANEKWLYHRESLTSASLSFFYPLFSLLKSFLI